MDFIIISVGNEILSGDILNTNAASMAKMITQAGHNVKKMITIPDDIDMIAEEVSGAGREVEQVLVTGGLGVTHDDITAEGIAKATGRDLEVNEVVYSFLQKRMKSEEAMEKMASVPAGAEVINNKVGAAPGFIVDNIAVMPGVPAEMEYIMERLLPRFGSSNYFVERINLKGYEDRIMNNLKKVAEEFDDVEIGSYPQNGHIIVKISGKDKQRVKKVKEKLERLIL